MSIIFINPYRFAPAYDADAQDFINRVIAADVAAGNTNGLEVGVQDAYNAFVIGCKADGTFSAIKACCIMAGARTLSGALVPLVGTAPTNVGGLFVSGDYNRETGLAGDGSTKSLNTNRSNNADPQNSKHLAVWRSTAATNAAGLLGSNGTDNGDSHLYTGFGFFINRNNASTATQISLTTHPGAIFYGNSRSSSTGFNVRIGGTNYSNNIASQTPRSASLVVFSTAGLSNARLAFYSIGESLDLELLDARVTTLINAIAAAIP